MAAILHEELGFAKTFLYDAAGRNTTVIYLKGQVKTTVFDDAGRNTAVLYT